MMTASRVLVDVLLGILMVQLVTGTTTGEGRLDDVAQGQKGNLGPPATRGAPGEPGLPGRPGFNGISGDPGEPGFPGLTGIKGEPGYTGPKGDMGQPGLPGLRGPAGPRGPPGIDGQPGSEDAHNAKGNRGPIGLDGMPGRPGDVGHEGDKGIKGQQGEKGGPCECGNIHAHRKRAVAFSAEVDKVPEPSLRPIPVPVTRIMADVGSWFQLNASRFVAPSAGVYAFSMVTISEGSVAVPISLVHNGQEVMYTGRTDTSVGINPVGANRIFLNLSVDDYVDVRVRPKEQGVVSSLADLFYSETRMTFLGYKVM